MSILVTGAAGFIGSNLVRALNARGHRDIIAVDNLTRADKFHNLVGCDLEDYFDKQVFLERLESGQFGNHISAVLHQGACSDTMHHDGRYMLENNTKFSQALLDFCDKQQISLIYASSAAVYGANQEFGEAPHCESPLNVYGYSKLLFDQLVRRRLKRATSQIVGLRYFNVYGPRETHKGRMASVAFHGFEQLRQQGQVRLFEGSHGVGPGEQRRDFVYVDDVVRVNLWFLDHPEHSGIFNVGTGRAQTFNDVAQAVINSRRRQAGQEPLGSEQMLEQGLLEYIEFPEALKGKYQAFTQANLEALRGIGYTADFCSVEQGVGAYADWLAAGPEG
jgi:ADP-L-glycero-D-manno-heptose 6-epimerase